jgi:hypothetical protein
LGVCIIKNLREKKVQQKNCDRKSAAEKVWQKNRNRKSAA